MRFLTRPAACVLLAAAGACALAYWPALSGQFLFDDIVLLVNNECWRGIEKIPAMFVSEGENPCSYRPGRYATFAVDYTIAGASPTWMHVSSFLYHLLAMLALYAVARRFAPALPAALVAAMWALHPVSSDAVAYISGRRDVVSTLLFLVSFCLLVPRDRGWPGWRALLLGLGTYYLAIRTKEMAVTLPAIALFAHWLYHRREGRGSGTSEARPNVLVGAGFALIGLIGAGFIIVRAVLRSESLMQGAWWGESIGTNFATVLALYSRYFELIVWPERLIGDYFPITIPLAESFLDPRAVIGALLLGALIAGAVLAYRRKQRVITFGIGWFLIAMLPVSHLFPHHELFAEHYLYLPLAGLLLACLPAVSAITSPSAHRLRLFGSLAIVVIAVLWVGRTHIRAYAFTTERAFYEAAIALAPDNVRARYTLGVLYAEQDECELALPVLAAAIEGATPGRKMSRNALAAMIRCAHRLGDTAGAAQAVTRLLRDRPQSRVGLVWRARLHYERGDLDAAVRDLTQVITNGSDDPGDQARLVQVLSERAQGLIRRGWHDRAREDLETLRALGVPESQLRALWTGQEAHAPDQVTSE